MAAATAVSGDLAGYRDYGKGLNNEAELVGAGEKSNAPQLTSDPTLGTNTLALRQLH